MPVAYGDHGPELKVDFISRRQPNSSGRTYKDKGRGVKQKGKHCMQTVLPSATSKDYSRLFALTRHHREVKGKYLPSQILAVAALTRLKVEAGGALSVGLEERRYIWSGQTRGGNLSETFKIGINEPSERMRCEKEKEGHAHRN